jgi:hypothetical protein
MFGKSKRFWITLGVCALVFLFYFPSLVAYRYTASSQNTDFLTHPWRSWGFAFAAFTVAGDSRLKTSGAAFRNAEQVFAGSQVRVEEARLLYLPGGATYTFTQPIDGRLLQREITPPYRFVWQIEGRVRTPADSSPDEQAKVIVGLFDYRSGRLLYDVRQDLDQAEGA